MSNLLNLSDEEIQQIKLERYTHGNIQIQKRLNAVYLMVTSDLTQDEIAHCVGCHRNNLRNWRDQCITEGLPSLYTNNYRKPKSILDDHSDTILSHFDSHPIQSINQAVAVIEDLTGIKRSPTQVREFLLRHDYRWRKMGQIPGKANVEEQKNWLENTLSPYIEKAQNGLLHLFFLMLPILP
jgi:transposase